MVYKSNLLAFTAAKMGMKSGGKGGGLAEQYLA